MSTVRRQGQLIQQDNTLDRNATSTPAGAAASGANPNESKMVGSRLERKNAINEAIDPNKTQQSVQRQQQFQAASPTDEQADQSSLGARLQRVSGLNDRVESLVRQRVDSASGGAQVNLATGGDLFSSLDAPAQEAVTAYTQAVQNGAGEDELSLAYERMATAVQAASGNGSTFDPATYLQQIDDNLASTYTESAGIQSTYKLGELTDGVQTVEEALGYEGDLAADLGVTPEELVELSIEDVQDRIKTLQEEEFSQVEALRTELRTASPDRKQEILDELKNLSSAGMTGAEDTVEGLQEQIESAQEVEFAGATFTLGELLEDDVISTFIKSAATNPDILEELYEEEPALAEWIETNKGALEDLVATSEGATESFRELQETFQKEFEGFEFSTLANLFDMTEEELGFVSQEELAAIQEAASNSSVFSAAQGNPELKQSLADLDPEILADLNELPQADIEEAFTMAQDIKNNPQLRDIVGEAGGDFILDSDKRDNIEKIQGILTALKGSDAIGDPQFNELVKNGTIDEDEAKYIAENPGEYDELVDWYNIRKETSNIGDIDDATKVLFGKPTDLDNINSQMDSLREKAKYGHTKARELLSKMEEWFGKTADVNDFTSIKEKLGKLIGIGADPIKAMQDNLNQFKDQSGLMNTNLGDVSPLYKKMHRVLSNAGRPQEFFDRIIKDGKVDEIEGQHLPNSIVEELMASGMMPYKAGRNILSRRAVTAKQLADEKENKRIANKIEARTSDIYNKYVKSGKDLKNINHEVLLNEGFSQREAKQMVDSLKNRYKKKANEVTDAFGKYRVDDLVSYRRDRMANIYDTSKHSPEMEKKADKLRATLKDYPRELLVEQLQKKYNISRNEAKFQSNILFGRE